MVPLRKVGMGYEVDAWVDIEQVKELSRVNGDLGRLGGLLKNGSLINARTQNFSPALINTR